MGATALAAGLAGLLVATAFLVVALASRIATAAATAAAGHGDLALATVALSEPPRPRPLLRIVAPAAPARLSASDRLSGSALRVLSVRARLSARGLPLAGQPLLLEAWTGPPGPAGWHRLARLVTGPTGRATATVAIAGAHAWRLAWPAGAQGVREGLARAILADRRISYLGRDVLADLRDSARGRPASAGHLVSTAILRLILAVGSRYPTGISAIESGGTGHCIQDGYWSEPVSVCPNDAHYRGDAVDFATIRGIPLTGRDPGALAVMRIAEQQLPPGSGFGQSECGAAPPLPPGWTTFPDSCDHLHVQAPLGSP